MSKLAKALLLACLATLALSAAPAGAQAASFGLTGVGVGAEEEDGTPAVGAGSHPYAVVTEMAVETEIDSGSGKVVPVQEAKDVNISFPAGMVGNPTAVPQCPAALFLAGELGECSDASALGIAEIEFGEPGKIVDAPVYNLVPAPGVAAKLGFIVEQRAPVTIDVGIDPESPNNVVAHATNISQALFFLRAKVTIWGVPANESHDSERGTCALSLSSCSVNLPEKPFLTMPAGCAEPLTFGFEADSWQNPDPPQWFTTSASIGGNATPLAPTGCGKLGFTAEVGAQATTSASASASGLDFSIDVDDPGLTSADGVSQARIEKAVVTLPEGMTLNPSAADGLGACSEADLARETPSSAPGAGCPQSAKVGEVEVETPLLEGKLLKGSVYVAEPYENPFDTLIALYMVIQDPGLGILIKLPGKVTPDPADGRLITTFGEPPYKIPQVPFSHFRFHFRSGARAPLITPPLCGAHTVSALLTPSTGAAALPLSSDFTTSSGPGGGPCPAGGVAPFAPGFEAGSINSAAGAFSPFYMRLTRKDGEQDMTRFDSVLPPGVTGKIAGLAKCPQAAIEAAKAKTGAAELAAPSCPASSLIGRTLAGAGVGSALTYVPGSLYLAGPYNGAPLSVAAVVPAVAGPFDVGTVVVQEALDLNPITAQVEIDGSASDPIPHILAGIPLNLRDLRVYVDRTGFTLNPTSCTPSTVDATLFGSFANPLDPADDVPASLSTRYQASSCASLGFKPKLTLRLKGGTKRNDHPALHSVLTARAGDANIGRAVVTLPHSEFIDPERINNPCTRVQFDADQCPAESVLGHARAYTPLLDEPLEGPVYFRSNGGERNIPDLAADLRGEGFQIVLLGFITSKNGRLRTSFENVPDAPVTKFVIELKGGKKGVLVNSANLCRNRGKRRVEMSLSGQNGRAQKTRPRLNAVNCHKKKSSKQHRR